MTVNFKLDAMTELRKFIWTKLVEYKIFDEDDYWSDNLNENIVPNVSSMVRGEELLELLNYIIEYLITHVHSYHGLPPVPTTTNGATTTELMKKMMDAYQKVLSQNFKIN